MRAPEPYFKARLRELREAGLALPPQRRQTARAACFEKLIRQCCDRVVSRVCEARDAFIYWTPSEELIAARKVQRGGYSNDPPEGGILVGRYRHPVQRAQFIDDLLLAIQKGKAA